MVFNLAEKIDFNLDDALTKGACLVLGGEKDDVFTRADLYLSDRSSLHESLVQELQTITQWAHIELSILRDR
jgi:hypothetical protein